MFSTYYLFKNNVLKYISIVLIFCVFCAQLSITETFYYTDICKTNFEIDISNKIIQDLQKAGIKEKSKIAIIGYKKPVLNNTCIAGEMVGKSSYNANHEAYPYYIYSTANILGVWRSIGYDYTACSGEQILEARKIAEEEKIPSWPEEGCIKNCGDYYLIKISEDDLPW